MAHRLRVHPRSVRMIPASDLPYLQTGWKGRRRYHPLDVSRYVEKYTRRS